jgi:hypothetical protein
MATTEQRAPADLRSAVRNRYFYGKMLDVAQLVLEQDYFNDKRQLLNRLVTGPGVVCGLDVQPSGTQVVVTPGLAIDRCGREIVVAKQSHGIDLPAPPATPPPAKPGDRPPAAADHCEEDYATVLLCYHECDADPVPAMGGCCDPGALCSAGSIRETYEIKVIRGMVPHRKRQPLRVIDGKFIDYLELAKYISRGCRSMPDDCCIPLANVKLRDTGQEYRPEDIDIGIRPIVFSNRLLFELIETLVGKDDKAGQGVRDDY